MRRRSCNGFGQDRATTGLAINAPVQLSIDFRDLSENVQVSRAGSFHGTLRSSDEFAANSSPPALRSNKQRIYPKRLTLSLGNRGISKGQASNQFSILHRQDWSRQRLCSLPHERIDPAPFRLNPTSEFCD